MLPEDHPLAPLSIADPELATDISIILDNAPASVRGTDLDSLVKDTLWALSQEVGFGKSVGIGYAQLLAGRNWGIQTYQSIIRDAGGNGPTVGKLMAIYLVPVLMTDDRGLLDEFMKTCQVMRRQGTYTLKGPLDGLSWLC